MRVIRFSEITCRIHSAQHDQLPCWRQRRKMPRDRTVPWHSNPMKTDIGIGVVRTFDLAARNAIVIGRIDPESEFFVGIIDRVMAVVSYPEDDEGEWDDEEA